MNSTERLKSVREAYKLLNELPSIGQTIGTLNQRLMRCKIDSPRYRCYEDNRNRLMNQQSDISFDVKMAFYHLLTPEEQEKWVENEQK